MNKKKVKAIGLSYGGLILLELTATRPELIESMVLVSASSTYSGKNNQKQAKKFTFENLPHDFLEQLRRLHLHGEAQIRALFDPTTNYEIKLTENDLKKISSRTLVVSGDNDEVIGSDAAFILHKYLPDSYLWIIPNSGHTPIYGNQKDDFIRLSTKFLKNTW